MKNSNLLFFATLTSLLLTGCGNSKPSSSYYDPREDEVSVFVMAGQSNMEGSTWWKHGEGGTDLLENYMNERELDFSAIKDGIPSILTTNYGFYYPSGWANANSSSTDKSSGDARLTPNFLPTTVGMGVGDRPGYMMGPEVGLSYTLKDEATEDKPIYLVKCAFSGSGFEKTDGPNWSSRDDDPTKSLFYLLKTYTHRALEQIEETGKTPIIKGFLWHQGESDGGNTKYRTHMETLLSDFKTEFIDYIRDNDETMCAFIDCTIYDGKGKSSMSYGTAANDAKLAIANESEDDLNFCIDAGFGEDGLKLEIGDDAKGGFNTYHYNTSDCFRLGEAYANIILDNGILDI